MHHASFVLKNIKKKSSSQMNSNWTNCTLVYLVQNQMFEFVKNFESVVLDVVLEDLILY